jgi:glycosyltransferase involved in cell wall biosynthesis
MTGETRVALVIGQLHAGGSERQVSELAPLLKGGPCEPVVYCLSSVVEPFGPRLEAAGIRLRVLPRRRSFEPRRVLALARLLREDRIDVVHSLSPNMNLYALLARRIAGRRPLAGANRALDSTCGTFEAQVNRLVFRRCEQVVVNSRAGRDFTARFYRVPVERIEVIPNGIDIRRFASSVRPAEARARAGLPAGVPLIGFVGRLSREKGVDLFLQVAREVVSRLPEAHFLVVGEGPLLAGARQGAREMGIGCRVIFTGFRQDVPVLLAAIDLLLLTSSQEGLPNAVLEAMAAGRPVVSTDVGGCGELVLDGVTGFLCTPGASLPLAERVVQVLSLPDRGLSLGAAGRRRAETEFGIDVMARRFEDLFRRLHRGGPRPAAS